jgi:bleomycin hydrolase
LSPSLTFLLTTLFGQFVDKNKKYQRIITTPLEFARKHTGYDVAQTISLINDPRHPFHELYTVQRLGNVVGGRPIRYLNLEVGDLKEIAIELLKVGFRMKRDAA